MTKTKSSKAYLPSEKEKYMCPKHIEYFKKKLLEWKGELITEAQETMQHLKEDSLNESDLIDKASVEIETASELRTRVRYRKLITKIDHALERISNKTYGYCEETGQPIGIKRLDARPIATMCIAAQEQHERQEKSFNDRD